nr:MAG: N-acetyltransferase [Chloroflexota bacterium]
MSSADAFEVRDNAAAQRFEVEIEGRLAMITYQRRGNTIVFTHTEVPPELEGRGIASRMARFALESAREQGLRVVARCPFVASYIRRHPEYQSLLAE